MSIQEWIMLAWLILLTLAHEGVRSDLASSKEVFSRHRASVRKLRQRVIKLAAHIESELSK